MKKYVILVIVILLSITSFSQDFRKIFDEKKINDITYRVECSLYESPKIDVYYIKGFNQILKHSTELNSIKHIVSDFDPYNGSVDNRILSVKFLDKPYYIIIETIHGIYLLNTYRSDDEIELIIGSEFDVNGNLLSQNKLLRVQDNKTLIIQKQIPFKLPEGSAYKYGMKLVGNEIEYVLK